MINWVLQNKEWAFSGIGVAMVSFLFVLIKKTLLVKNKKHQNDDKYRVFRNTGNNIGNKNNISGNFAGRDVIVYQDNSKERRDEFVLFLNLKAKKIIREIPKLYKNERAEGYVQEFISLHNKHIEAIKSGNLIYAHELLNEIHDFMSHILAIEVDIAEKELIRMEEIRNSNHYERRSKDILYCIKEKENKTIPKGLSNRFEKVDSLINEYIKETELYKKQLIN